MEVTELEIMLQPISWRWVVVIEGETVTEGDIINWIWELRQNFTLLFNINTIWKFQIVQS